MKIFFIASNIIFLSSIILANTIGILYQHKINSGVEWRSFGDQTTQPKFEGNILNKKPNGSGKLTYPNGNKFEGFFKDGEPHGEGTFSWAD